VIRNSRRMVVVAIAGAFAVAPAVSACGAGEEPQTAEPTQLTEGVNVTTKNGVAVRDLFVLGPEPGQQLAAGSAATVYASVVNNSTDGQPDRLIAVAAPGVAQTGQIQGGAVNLPYQRLVRLGVQAPTGVTTPLLTLQGLTAPLTGGEPIKLTLQFERSGSLQVTVPVVPRNGSYITYAPPSPPSPSPTQSAPSGSPTPTETSPTPTETP
jgi:copper(I)-binding protein